MPTVASATWHARSVADTARTRRAEEVGIRVQQAAKSGNAEALAAALADAARLHAQGEIGEPAPGAKRGSGATPLTAGHGHARRFPVEHLPPMMREYVVDLAERKQVPVDLPA